MTTPTESVRHTPGPWVGCKDCKCPCGAIWDATGEMHLATAFDETALGMEAFGSDVGVCRAERIANAHLIAAAPELLDALKGCVLALQIAKEATGLDQPAYVIAAQRAIAKARGEAA